MKAIVFGIFGLLSLGLFAQEVEEEFLPISVEGKEAFMSTKTGEYTYLEHAKTDATQLKTTPSGVVYTDISSHTIKKGETLSAVAKKNNVSIDEIKKHNKVASSKLKIGTKLKIVKNLLIKSSSPVISYAGEERIIAALRPGESPGQFAAPPSVAEVESQVIETKKSEEKPSATVYKAETSIKNPIFGLDNSEDTQEDESLDNLSEAISKEVKEAKEAKEVKVAAPNPEIIKEAKTESKKQKLARLKAEMQALESELEVETTEAVVEEPKKVVVKDTPKVTVIKNIPKNIEDKVIDGIKVTNPEAKIETDENERQVRVFENKPKVEESTAEKATRVLVSVRKTEQEVEVSKNEKIKVEAEAESTPEEKETTYYTVVKGNSLWSIAQKHNMSVEALKKLNNLKNNSLDVGQKLKVISLKN